VPDRLFWARDDDEDEDAMDTTDAREHAQEPDPHGTKH
jgi:hypothetical protein